MPDELAQILAVDEECRSRVAFEQKRIERELAEIEQERQNVLREQERAAAEALAEELAKIRAEGDARIAERHGAAGEYLKRLAERGEERLEAAAQLYAGIIRGETEGADR